MKDLPKVIYVMGAPGAGKGTQAELLAQKIGYQRFSTGNAFRTVSRQDTELGKEVRELIDNGYLAPPELAAKIVVEAVATHLANGEGLIFDGTPRTREEAAIVDKWFQEHSYGVPLAIHLKVDQAEMMRRNLQRRFCLGGSDDFPVQNEQDEQRCTGLGGHVGVRPDDEPEKFATRWQQFMDRTWPVIEQYRQQGILHEVNGQQSIDAVASEIVALLDGFVLPSKP